MLFLLNSPSTHSVLLLHVVHFHSYVICRRLITCPTTSKTSISKKVLTRLWKVICGSSFSVCFSVLNLVTFGLLHLACSRFFRSSNSVGILACAFTNFSNVDLFVFTSRFNFSNFHIVTFCSNWLTTAQLNVGVSNEICTFGTLFQKPYGSS